MSEIATFSCTEAKCRFTVRIASNFPLWHKDTPKNMLKLPIQEAARKYVIGYRSDTYCLDCKEVTTLNESALCKRCGANLYEDLSKQPCAQCKKSRINLTHLIVR